MSVVGDSDTRQKEVDGPNPPADPAFTIEGVTLGYWYYREDRALMAPELTRANATMSPAKKPAEDVLRTWYQADEEEGTT